MKGNSILFANIRYESLASGDVSYMGDGNSSLFAKFISKRADVDVNGTFDVIAHSKSTFIQIVSNDKKYNLKARDAAKLIKRNDGYKKCKSIRLFSCNTGSDKKCFAQNLANSLGKPVYAPNNYIRARSDGTYFIAGMLKTGKPNYNDLGKFIKFIPGGNINEK